MTRGFVTIATGKEMYYQLAKNLLLSYRLFCKNPYPFAIMCDAENEYTRLFDKTILFQPSGFCFFDKFELLKRTPYDETIFIDADCLAYDDLNQFWDYFAEADDFSASGDNYSIDCGGGLFQYSEIGEYQNRVQWRPDIHGGLYFIRKGPVCDKIYEDCKYIGSHYHDFHWAECCAPYADEPVLCLAMAANGCHATGVIPENYGIPWEVTRMEVDIFTGKCRYSTAWHPMIDQGRMIHWSVRYCKKPLYRFEAEKLHLMVSIGFQPGLSPISLNFKDKILYQWKFRYFFLCAQEFLGRVYRKIKRMLTKQKPD